ncbi:MAG: N-acetyltransferase family protein [Betaproteobacteria bacterium]
MTCLQVVQAAEEHLPGITAIYNEAVQNSTATFDTEPKTLDDRRRWLAEHGEAYPVLVALDPAGQVLAWGSLSPYSDRLAYRFTVEDSLYVHPQARGQGLGSLLLGRLVELAQEHNYHTIIAKIVDGNAASLAVHRRHGFTDVGTMRQVGYKFGRWLDVTILQRTFGQG